MHFSSILVCIAFFPAIDALPISKLKLNVPDFQSKPKIQETIKTKLPEDRRKLSIFPKSNKKFVVSLESDQHEIANPIIHLPKRPLMKKIVIKTKEADSMDVVIAHVTKQPVMNTKLFKENQVVKLRGPKTIREKSSVNNAMIKSEELEQKENNEMDIETQTGVYPDEPNDADDIELDHFILKLTEVNKNVRQKRLLKEDDIEGGEKNEDVFEDWNEFIFLQPLKRLEEVLDSVEDTTAEYSSEPNSLRIKRSDNVIEEENLATTVSAFKFTWHDTQLTNDMQFKNIHS